MFRFDVALGGTGFRLQSASQRIIEAARAHFRGFEGDGPWEVVLEEADPRAIGGSAMTAERTADGWRIAFGGEIAATIAGQRVTARLGAMPDFFPPGSVQNLLRVLLVLDLAPRGGVLLHASAFADPEGGRAFFGASGAGKSTLARAFAAG